MRPPVLSALSADQHGELRLRQLPRHSKEAQVGPTLQQVSRFLSINLNPSPSTSQIVLTRSIVTSSDVGLLLCASTVRQCSRITSGAAIRPASARPKRPKESCTVAPRIPYASTAQTSLRTPRIQFSCTWPSTIANNPAIHFSFTPPDPGRCPAQGCPFQACS